jgi:CubicO group peptidase (beta-lactamase class C family)
VTISLELDLAKLDKIFEPYNRSDQPGLVVGVAHRGLPIYRRGFGLASVELPVTLSPDIRIRIGSTTKHFCCLAIMLLAEDGKLSPDDSVRRHIPELGDWADTVTLTALMSHTGGVRCSLDIVSMTSNGMGKPLPTSAQLKILTDLESANFAAGDAWLYSNGGYVLLTEVVERVAASPFGTFLKDRILDPVGLDDTLLRPVDTSCLPNSATLHVRNAQGGFDRGVFGPAIGGEGGMVSTVNDMLRWLKHMNAPRVGSPATWAAMRTPVRLNSGASTGYGFGLFLGDHRGLRTVHHSGNVLGGASQMLKVVGHDLDIVMMSNLAGIGPVQLTEAVLDACFTGLEPQVETTPGPSPTGDFYSVSSGRLLRLANADGVPAIDFDGPAPFPIKRTADGALFAPGLTDIFLVPRDAGVDWREFGAVDHLEPVAAPAVPEIESLVGVHVCQEIGVTAEVTADDAAAGGAARLLFNGQLGEARYRLDPRGPGVWSAISDALGGGGVVERADDGFLFSSSRVRRLRFVRTEIPA